MDAQAAIDECSVRAAPAGSDLYYATLHLAPSQRAAVLSLLALSLEVTGVLRSTSDPGVAQLRLAWWKEELSLLASGSGRHPIGIALRATGAIPRVPIDDLLSLVECATRRLDAGRCHDIASTIAAHRQYEGEWWRCVALLTGDPSPRVSSLAATLGTAIGMIATLRSLRDDVRAGIARLPADVLGAHGVERDELATATPAAIRAIATVVADRAETVASEGIAAIAAEDAVPLLPQLISAEIARRTLGEMRTDGFAVMQRRVSLTPLRKLWIALGMRRRWRRR